MENVLYVSVVGSLMYAMVCTQSVNDRTVGVLSRYMSSLERSTGLL